MISNLHITYLLVFLFLACNDNRLDVVEDSVPYDYKYTVFQPSNMEFAENGKLPLILFLHGAGERGDDLDLVAVHGPPMIVKADPDFPFMVVSPQCPLGVWWDAGSLGAVLDAVESEYPIDPSRIYVSGLSMGGYGTWDMAIKYPNRFAALLPICGGDEEDAAEAETFKHIPSWVFHGAKDQVIPIENSQKIVDALEALNADVTFTIYPDANHNSWTETYNNEAIYSWLLSHRL